MSRTKHEEPIDRSSLRYQICFSCAKEFMAKTNLKKQKPFYRAQRKPGRVLVDFTIGDLDRSKDFITY